MPVGHVKKKSRPQPIIIYLCLIRSVPISYKSLEDIISSHPGMNYTFAREILRKCRTVTGVGNIRVWKAEFNGVLRAWKENPELAEMPLSDADANRSMAGDKAFADAWRNWAKAE